MKRTLLFSSVAALLLVSGCSNSTTEEAPDAGTIKVGSSLVQKSPLAVGSTECATGGVSIKIGFDTTGNSEIDKVTQTEIICNGEVGQDGADGVTGITGQTGSAGENGLDGKDGIASISFNRYGSANSATKVQFSEIATPLGDAALEPQAASMVTIDSEIQAIEFTKLMATGDVNNGEIFGALKDYKDEAITFADGTPYVCNGTNSGVGSGLDFTSILQKNNKLFMVSQFECQVGAMYMAELDQDPVNGALSVKPSSLEFISQSDEFGGFVHCAGQKTPWESHLGSEEYEPNARFVEEDADALTGLTGSKYYDETAKFWKDDIKLSSPYYYGWTPEVTIALNDAAVYKKHYAMGRMSHELSYVMPDQKTVYMSDDGTNVGLFMFVADKPADLSEGTLYAAKWIQVEAANGGKADLTWIKLGHSDDATLRALVDPDNNVSTNDAPVFSDIFNSEDVSEDGSCATLTSINTTAGHECLSLKSGMETTAAYLETRRYAALKGATTEFRKEEGITFDADHNRLYVAMSQIAYGMESEQKKGSDNDKYDVGSNNDIRLGYNPCGGIYALDLKESAQVDMDGNIVPSSYVVNNMYAVLTGEPASYPAGHPYEGNTCSVNGISNPDNITYLEGSNILSIGEDTSYHKNNIVWAYDVENGALTRTFTTPTAAETTSPFWYKNVNGYGYQTLVTQHPIDDDNSSNYLAEEESFVGVFGPFNFTKLDQKIISKVGTLRSIGDDKNEGGSEIVAFDKTSKKMFITNGANNRIDVATINADKTLTLESSIDMSAHGAAIQSVSVSHDKVAVAVGSANKVSSKGKVVLMDTDGSNQVATEVGFLPDMVTFNEDGTSVIVANEGEPQADTGVYVDPMGSIGVLTVANNAYEDINFSGATLSSATDGTQVRLGGTPSDDLALDLEPEYITVSNGFAYITLQENNAVAKLDLSNNTLVYIKSLGAKDHSLSKNALDIEEDGVVKLSAYPNLFGLFQPDTIQSYVAGGQTYLVTANEGDGRSYPTYDVNDSFEEGDLFEDEKKIKKLDLDPAIADAYENENDLKVMVDMGDANDDGVYEKLYAYGARSFSIWDEDANLVFDSANLMAQIVYQNDRELFNHDDFEKDGRSGNKGMEPEALAVGEVDGVTYAFVGLERQSAIMIFDISNPQDVRYVDYIASHKDNDIAPEGMKFISQADSPTGKALLLVAYEVSSTTVVYEIK